MEQQALTAARDAANGALPAADPRARPDANAAALAVQNGEGESLGVSSGILQVRHVRYAGFISLTRVS